ncbi:alpha/beta-hydrolase [Coprinopsis marcescibilis]|uniref:Alpha/beta-hydrolase n=1 Tax=Coprinopsis marcescibilis TaxID=230819 RepID=A0A5C3LAM8_COPMA|nr:alpha/beta-hydrolase [Coprinopsis marcescibilis]
MSASLFSVHTRRDGSRQAYEILGTEHIGTKTPLVLINGMSMLRGDWQRLSECLAKFRPVLIFDHRGMGDSTFSTDGDEKLTLELMARDILALVVELKWQEVAVCGYSMGGAIAQQLLFLPFHSENPTPLPFRVTHVLLTATLCESQRNNTFTKSFAQLPPSPKNGKRTQAEKRELARPTTEAIFDPIWLARNPERFDHILDIMTSGRPVNTILMQARALGKMKFDGFHEQIPRDIKVLVLHGELDQVLPFSSSRQVLKRIPWAKDVEVGGKPGQVPSLAFGHQWFEYFDIAVWKNVIEMFLNDVELTLQPRL